MTHASAILFECALAEWEHEATYDWHMLFRRGKDVLAVYENKKRRITAMINNKVVLKTNDIDKLKNSIK